LIALSVFEHPSPMAKAGGEVTVNLARLRLMFVQFSDWPFEAITILSAACVSRGNVIRSSARQVALVEVRQRHPNKYLTLSVGHMRQRSIT
jgi:hypothetical protein